MEERKSALLSAIIKEHISTGHTVGSKAIVDKYGFSVSPATVRNEMGYLEKNGYIHQPHTSAGRIPTEKGWRFFIDNFLKDKELTKSEKSLLEKAGKEVKDSYEIMVKNMAKTMAEISKEAVIVGFEPENVYYTGLSNLFQQPEFKQLDLVCHVSQIVDHLDEVIENIFDEISDEVKIMIGKENPFGIECGSVMTKYQFGNKYGMFGILGPIRQNYENNIAILKYAKGLISN